MLEVLPPASSATHGRADPTPAPSALPVSLQDALLMGSYRVAAATSPDFERQTFGAGGLGSWVQRMKDACGEEFALALERDPK